MFFSKPLKASNVGGNKGRCKETIRDKARRVTCRWACREVLGFVSRGFVAAGVAFCFRKTHRSPPIEF